MYYPDNNEISLVIHYQEEDSFRRIQKIGRQIRICLCSRKPLQYY